MVFDDCNVIFTSAIFNILVIFRIKGLLHVNVIKVLRDLDSLWSGIVVGMFLFFC